MRRPAVLPNKINSWTVLDRRGGETLAKCDCGNIKWISTHNLRTGKSKRCIKCHRDNRVQKYVGTRAYGSWQNMRTRCNNPNSRDYRWYGARGIVVCPEWNKFENFLKDMGDPPTQLHTIERNDVNGNYEPSNCRWATMEEQRLNKRTTEHPLGKSGERWISITKDSKYRVTIGDKYIGVYKTLDEAILIRNKETT
jgi:hypothetical protein